jgi:hypothetical protein
VRCSLGRQYRVAFAPMALVISFQSRSSAGDGCQVAAFPPQAMPSGLSSVVARSGPPMRRVRWGVAKRHRTGDEVNLARVLAASGT